VDKIIHFPLLTVEGYNLPRDGFRIYSIYWDKSFQELLAKAAVNESKMNEMHMISYAWYGLGSRFFGWLRTKFPKAFLLSNMAIVSDSIHFVSRFGFTVDELLKTYQHRKIDWDYGWTGEGVPIENCPSHIFELNDLSPMIPEIMGGGPAEMSFVLMLAGKEMTLDDICVTIQDVKEIDDWETKAEDWEKKVLSTVAMLGFPHEEVMYSIKTKNTSMIEMLDKLISANQQIE